MFPPDLPDQSGAAVVSRCGATNWLERRKISIPNGHPSTIGRWKLGGKCIRKKREHGLDRSNMGRDVLFLSLGLNDGYTEPVFREDQWCVAAVRETLSGNRKS